MSFPSVIITIIYLIGLLTTSYYCTKLIKTFCYRVKFGVWPKNAQEYKYFLLLEENNNLKKRLEDLEKENSEIFNSIMNQIK